MPKTNDTALSPSLSWRQRLGLARSLWMYYGNSRSRSRLQAFYGQFIRPGDLCFDIGAHLGNRIRAWRGLGARVIALEPQPACWPLLERWYGNDPEVILSRQAAGATTGQATLLVSERTPTVSTLSQSWKEQVTSNAESFQNVSWDSEITVPVTTLDALIAAYGLPTFCKIDVEGFEIDVLRGLSQPLAALSFEYIPAVSELSVECVEYLQTLGDYTYNWSISESQQLRSAHWLSADEIIEVLRTMPAQADSGDVYAKRVK